MFRKTPTAQAASLLCVLLLGSAAPRAQAQTAPATPAAQPGQIAQAADAPARPADGGKGQEVQKQEEIVVTAQKRSQTSREVPLSVSAIGANTLNEKQINSIEDLSRNTPNISFSGASGAGAGLNNIEIRGVSSAAGNATVGLYLDDISLSTRNLYSQGTAEPRMFDIARVEVLRGPQGTLYGAGSMGGTIRFISNPPNLRDFEGEASAGVSRTQYGGTNYEVQGILNVPVSRDAFALRMGVQAGHLSGYIDQVDPNTLKVVSKGINSANWQTLRLSGKAVFNPDWSLTPALFYQNYKADDIDAAYRAVGDYQNNAGTPLPLFQTSKIVREPGKDELTIPSLTLNGNLGFADLTAVASNYTRKFDRTQDGTFVNSSYIGTQVLDPATGNPDPVLGAIVGALPSAVLLNNKMNQNALELRLASKEYDANARPYTWLAGLYYARAQMDVRDNEPVYGITSAFAAAGRDVNDPNALAGSFPGAFPNDNSYFATRRYVDQQTSVFGEFTYYPSPSLRLSAGVRYLKARQEFVSHKDYYFAGGPFDLTVNTTSDATTPRFAASWDASKEVTLYANAAKGFRLGGAIRPIPLTPVVQDDLKAQGLPPTIPIAYKPDSLWNYELGSKARLLDNRLSLDAAVYHIDWRDLQQNVVLQQSGYDFDTNTGNAKIDGFEVEFRARLSREFTLSGGGNVTRAVFSEDVPALGFQADGVTPKVRKGDRIQGVPRYSLNLGGEYRFLETAQGSSFVRVNLQWTGGSRGSSFDPANSDFDRPSYFTADLSAGYGTEQWTATLFVKNATNTQTIIQQPSVQGVNTAYYLRPRTIGLSFKYSM
jgi:outer membrane receptor protein involved in Fe transport